jgi:hypothetical protein
MTTKQNIAKVEAAESYDIARLIVKGLAGERSQYTDLELWTGREWEAVHRAAEELLPLYRQNLLPAELLARLGRSMVD